MNIRYQDELAMVQGMSAGAAIANHKNEKQLKKLRENITFSLAEIAFKAIVTGHYSEAIATLKAADVVNPKDPLIQDLLMSIEWAKKKLVKK
jgi:hypothetical protein